MTDCESVLYSEGPFSGVSLPRTRVFLVVSSYACVGKNIGNIILFCCDLTMYVVAYIIHVFLLLLSCDVQSHEWILLSLLVCRFRPANGSALPGHQSPRRPGIPEIILRSRSLHRGPLGAIATTTSPVSPPSL